MLYRINGKGNYRKNSYLNLYGYREKANSKPDKYLFAIFIFTVILVLCPILCNADGSQTNNSEKLQHFVDSNKLHKNVQQRIEQTGEADVLVILDSSAANSAAIDLKKNRGATDDTDEIIKTKSRLHRKIKDDLLAAINGSSHKVLDDYENLPILHMSLNRAALNTLLDNPEVILVSENTVFPRQLMESFTPVDALRTNSIGLAGNGTSVAVLDTAINYTHPALGACSSPGVPAGCKVSYAQDFVSNNAALENRLHGTNVASIIVGIAPSVKIVALNVFSSDGFAYEADVVRALEWVLTNRMTYNITAVNLSLGTGKYSSPCPSLAVAMVIADLKRAGIVTIVPSGNNGFADAVSYPACSPDALSVGAVYESNSGTAMSWLEANCTDMTTAANQVACFSNSASFLNILAPGVSIAAGGTTLSGTSQAAAQVSGAIASIKSSNPALTADQVVSGVIASGIPVNDARNGLAFPRLDMESLLGVPTADQGSSNQATTNAGGNTKNSDASATESATVASSISAVGQKHVTEATNPGWITSTGSPSKIKFTEALLEETSKNLGGTNGEVSFSSMSATDTSTEIVELARSLRGDPKLIYDYVHNNIDYVPYYGSTKGATLTLLDGSGNDFDQASLMISLLSASGYTAQYMLGTMTIPGSQLANWLGVDQNYNVIYNVLSAGGVPVVTTNTADGTARVKRIWVKANINGVDYLFDPAFKVYSDSGKIDIKAAMNFNQADFLTGATTGASVYADYVQNLNDANIRSKLTTYANNLTAAIRNSYANKSVEEIISGRRIVQSSLSQYSTTLPFLLSGTSTITDPSTYSTTIRIKHWVCTHYTNSVCDQSVTQFNKLLQTPDLSGKRLTLTYTGANYSPVLTLDGVTPPLATGTVTTPGAKYNVTMTINHPYILANGDTTYMDQTVDYVVESGRNYAIVYNFGGVSDTLLQKRQQQLDGYKAQGLADSTEAVLGETLHIMGMTWLKEVMQANKLLSAVADTITITHHNVGLMSQESGYFIDVKAGAGSILSRHDTIADANAAIRVYFPIASAFEHGILEQLAGYDKPGVSTIKLLQIANNTNRKVYLTDKYNYAAVRSLLGNYTVAELDDFQKQVDSGASLILPDNGQLVLQDWKGKGYISKETTTSSTTIGMKIGGGYFGGFCATSGYVNIPRVTENVRYSQSATATPLTANLNINTTTPSKSRDPVDMAGGSFLYDHTDLSMSSSLPMGVGLNRSYDSSVATTKRNMGYGWGHSYDIYLTPTSHGEPGLGLRQPVDAAAMIAALYASYDVMKSNDTLSAWMVSSLAAKWAIDQVINNAVVVHIGQKVMEFIRLADGSYASPPGITSTIIKNSDGTFSLVERFGNRIDFNSNNQASQMVDVDGNTLTFTYNGTTLSSVQDAFNHALAFSYDSGNRLTGVTDSTGRNVTFGYNAANDLISFTDPEQKNWGYGYDSGHRMTTMTNPLSLTTVTNLYDSLNRVKSQTVPRQGAPGATATYNFYFTGFRNSEVDPAGNATTYYYDAKGREIAVENALGQKSSRQYDGQNHIVMSSDPRNNVTSFLYDNHHNLIRLTDPLGNATNNTYDAQFRLTDSSDSLSHASHFDYDSKHHLILSRNGAGNANTSAYYSNGLRYSVTDAGNIRSLFTYDSYGNPLTETVANHPAVTYSYDSFGRMAGLVDQVGSQSTFTYDKRNLLLQKTDPLGKSAGFIYDSAGQLSSRTDRNGATVTYGYTPSGKLATITYPNGATLFTYNLHDQLTALQDGLGITTYSYDAAGRLSAQTTPFGFTVGYTYDAAGNLTGLTYPGGKKVLYSYDALNRLTTVTIDWLPGKPVATYTYDSAGRMTGLTTFNGSATGYSYDAANRLTALAGPVAGYSFTLDANGNRVSESRTEPLSLPNAPTIITYTYNTGKNRLLTAGNITFGYDNEGQLAGGYGSSYAFDYEHRLTGAGSSSYAYDGTGQRLQATRNGVTTRYLYDQQGNLLAEADNNNTITRYYIHGAGLLAMVTPANVIYCYHYNAVGSTIALTDSNQALVNKYAYDPFGNIGNQVETFPQPFKYVGQFGVMSEPNGFYYMRARYYDPQVGRFISEDPKGFDGGDVNLMVYVSNQPINYIDPSGLLKFNIFGQTVDIKLGLTILGFNGQSDLQGFKGSNFYNNAVVPPVSAGIGVDISINPPTSNNYIAPYVGFGKNLSVGVNLEYNPKTYSYNKLHGYNISLGYSAGIPVGATVPNAFSSNSCSR